MDQEEIAVLTAVDLGDQATAQKWFDALRETHATMTGSGDRSGTTLARTLKEHESLGSSFQSLDVDAVGRVLERRWDAIGTLTKEPTADLVTRHFDEMRTKKTAEQTAARQRAAQEQAAAAATAAAQVAKDQAAEDQGVWQRVLAEEGRHWDGTLSGWTGFRRAFLAKAEAEKVALLAAGFIALAEEEQAEAGRRAVFTRYRVPGFTAEEAARAKPPTEFPPTWDEFVRKFWPKVDSTWPQYRDWFYHNVKEAKFGQDVDRVLREAREALGDGFSERGAFAAYHARITGTATVVDDAEPDVTGLAWVTSAQVERLDRMRPVLGPWATWLPDELDANVPGWNRKQAKDLESELDALIAKLDVPSPEQLDAYASDMTKKIAAAVDGHPEWQGFLGKRTERQLEALLERALTGKN